MNGIGGEIFTDNYKLSKTASILTTILFRALQLKQ